MATRRHGRPASPMKIRDALKPAKNIDEVYDILDRGRFNLTDVEERKVVSDWKTLQGMLSVHGKGAYAQEIAA